MGLINKTGRSPKHKLEDNLSTLFIVYKKHKILYAKEEMGRRIWGNFLWLESLKPRSTFLYTY